MLDLVEEPTGVAGEFERSNLELPPEVVVSEMRNHQRYFAVVDGQGKLKNRFVAVSGTPVKDPEGRAPRLRARAPRPPRRRALLLRGGPQAQRSHDRDRGPRPPDLPGAARQRARPHPPDRRHRRRALARALGKEELVADLLEAARLAKADLGTGMVGEFPELQGIMGGHYARRRGAEARGRRRHRGPLQAARRRRRRCRGATSARSSALADRLHALVGIIGVGEKATGAADPFGLRRAAIGILRIVARRAATTCRSPRAIEETLDALPGVQLAADRAVGRGAGARLRARPREGALERGVRRRPRRGGARGRVRRRRRRAARLEALAEVKARPDFMPLAVAFKRVANIQEKAGRPRRRARCDPALLRDDAERPAPRRAGAGRARRRARAAPHRDYPAVLRNVATLEPAVARFFDDVLVMAEDAALRANRLGLMRRVGALFAGVADFRKIQAELPPAARAG